MKSVIAAVAALVLLVGCSADDKSADPIDETTSTPDKEPPTIAEWCTAYKGEALQGDTLGDFVQQGRKHLADMRELGHPEEMPADVAAAEEAQWSKVADALDELSDLDPTMTQAELQQDEALKAKFASAFETPQELKDFAGANCG